MTNLILADDPNRCQRSTPAGQCPNLSIPGTDRCESHTRQSTKLQTQQRNYDIQDARLKLSVENRLLSAAHYSLIEETAILRSIMQNYVNELTHPDAITRSIAEQNYINAVEKLQKLIINGHKLEKDTGNLLTKESVANLMHAMAEIIQDVISGVDGYEQLMDEIYTRLGEALGSARNVEQ